MDKRRRNQNEELNRARSKIGLFVLNISMAKKEISREHILPDASGNRYERDEHYWQDVTETWKILYEDFKFLKKSINSIRARQAELYPTPFQIQNHIFADKWNLIVDKKYITEYEYNTYAVDLGPVESQVWKTCTKSSNWNKEGAKERMMNMLSYSMPDSVFNDRLGFVVSRGCNYINLFVTNHADGEYTAGDGHSGYSIYGPNLNGCQTVNMSYINKMKSRISACQSAGLKTVLWLMADDDRGWNLDIEQNFNKFCSDLNTHGFLDIAPIIIIGLEIDEYFRPEDNGGQRVKNLIRTLKNYYPPSKGKIGVHFCSRCTFYNSYLESDSLMFAQTDPGYSDYLSYYRSVVEARPAGTVCAFELERFADRSKSQNALNVGCFSCGNW